MLEAASDLNNDSILTLSTIYVDSWIEVPEKRRQQRHLPANIWQQIGTGVEGPTVLAFSTAAVNILSWPLDPPSKNSLL